MTAKQKANRERFKKVVAEAKKLRKKNPSLTQAQAVKQAWAIQISKEKKNPIERVKKYIEEAKEGIRRGYYGSEYKKKRKKIGATKKKATPTKVKAKKSKRTSEMHTDTKSHNVNIRVMSGVKVKSKELRKKLERQGYKLTHGYAVAKRKSIGDLPKYSDPDAAREMELYGDNDSQLYFQMRRPILVNLGKKYKKGTYDVTKAAKLWRYYIDAVMKKYNKEFGGRGDKWYDLLSTHDRQLLAMEYAVNTKAEFDLGNFTE